MAEHRVGQVSTLLQNGQMKRVELEGQPVVLARVDGQYHAFGATCTHYGGPLDEGVLRGHTVMCPWHHACFDIRSGLRLEPPALNDLPHYPVRVDGDQVVVTLPQDNESEPHGKASADDNRTFVIVGGGSAGNSAAEELRRNGYQGKIVMLSGVNTVPVDRPNLSKDYLAAKADPAWIPLRGDESWYTSRDIDLRLNTTVNRVDPKAHTVITDRGESIHYDKLLLATGGTPRHLNATPGADLEGLYTLRTLADADAIIAAAEHGKRAVIIGASFIGMEGAASLAGGRGVTVTVVGIEKVPFATILGEDLGKMLQKEHEDNGVQFRLNSEVARFVGKDGHVNGVELKNGEILPADFVIVGIGVRPATDFLAESGLALDDKDKSVRVKATLQSSDPDIYAAGDIARWDNGSERGERIEHWRVAEQQGIVAAHNMLGLSDETTRHVPFFWSNQWSVTVNYVGHANRWDEIIYRGGTPAEKKFMAFYMQNGKPLAVTACNYDRELDAVEFILRDGLPLSAAQIRDESFDLVHYAETSQTAKTGH